MKKIESFNLKTNPFRTVPAISNEDIMWAGFKETKNKFDRRIRRIINLPNSVIALNWGEYGSGKTHAARYFSKEDVLQAFCPAEQMVLPLSIVINFPSNKNSVKELFTSIVDKLDFCFIHQKMMNKQNPINASSITDSKFAQKVIDYLSCTSFDGDLYMKYLYGSLTAKEKEKLGFLRSIETDNDIIDIIAALFSFLTENKVYSAIILWIDEFEHIASLSSSNINSINNFIKILFDKTPNRLLLMINLTLSAMGDRDDLTSYLHDAVKSRIKEYIEFSIPTPEQLIDYLYDILNIYRINEMNNSLFPFDEDLINHLITELGDVSLRKFNEALSSLIENALYDDKESIDMAYFEQIKTEIIGWQNV